MTGVVDKLIKVTDTSTRLTYVDKSPSQDWRDYEITTLSQLVDIQRQTEGQWDVTLCLSTLSHVSMYRKYGIMGYENLIHATLDCAEPLNSSVEFIQRAFMRARHSYYDPLPDHKSHARRPTIILSGMARYLDHISWGIVYKGVQENQLLIDGAPRTKKFYPYSHD